MESQQLYPTEEWYQLAKNLFAMIESEFNEVEQQINETVVVEGMYTKLASMVLFYDQIRGGFLTYRPRGISSEVQKDMYRMNDILRNRLTEIRKHLNKDSISFKQIVNYDLQLF